MPSLRKPLPPCPPEWDRAREQWEEARTILITAAAYMRSARHDPQTYRAAFKLWLLARNYERLAEQAYNRAIRGGTAL